MSKQKLLDMYSPVMPDKKANAFVDQVFSKFDTDNSGTIDFKVRFKMKTLIHCRSSCLPPMWRRPRAQRTSSGRRSKCTTGTDQVCAKKHTEHSSTSVSGTIDSTEMTEIVSNLCAMEGTSQVYGILASWRKPDTLE